MTSPPAAPAPTSSAGRRWHYKRSLASRVTLLTTMAVGLAVALMALGAFLTVRAQMQSTLDQSLKERASRASEAGALAAFANNAVIPSWALGAADVRIAFVAADGRAYWTDRQEPVPLGRPEVAVSRRLSPDSIRTVDFRGTSYRVVAVPSGTTQSLVVAQPLDAQQQVLSRLGLVLGLFGAGGVLAAGLSGWGVARNGLRPVRRLTSSVEEIARTEDLRPLPVEGADEVARLATAFNGMLTALAASRDRQRRLVADAGHELRTPLTSLRTNIDLLTQADAGPGTGSGVRGLSAEARAELLDDVRAQTEELTTLVGALVELARDEPLPPVVESVDLADLVDRAVVRVRRRAPAVRLEVELEPWLVQGESEGLEKAALNLLDNAVKWSPPGGTVQVSLSGGRLRVDDAGPGIAPADVPHVFDRFWRSEESRTLPGSGLGLAIVRQVVDRHSGTVAASVSPAGGARLEMWLPGVPASAPTV